MINHMLSLLKSGTAHADQVFSSLKIHVLGEFDLVFISRSDTFHRCSFKQCVGACEIIALLVAEGICKYRCFDMRLKADPFSEKE